MKLFNGLSNIDSNMVNSDLKEKYTKLENEHRIKLSELDSIKFNKIIYENEISTKNKEIEDLKNKLFQSNRRNSCHPVIPYINFSKEHFKQNKLEHECACHFCGQEFSEMKEKLLSTLNSNEFNSIPTQIISSSINEESLNVSHYYFLRMGSV
jgi:hypothetical protein